MDFLNKTKGTLLNAGKNFSQKASSASGLVALNMRIHEEEKSLNEAFLELGKLCYEQQTVEMRSFCAAQLDKIQNLLVQIDKDKKELAVCKGMRICPNCGSEQQPESMCCTMCGMNMNEVERMVADQYNTVIVCPECGKAIDENSKFCSYCGAKCNS